MTDYDGSAAAFRKARTLGCRSLTLARKLDGPNEYDGRLSACTRAAERALHGLRAMRDCGVFVDGWRDLPRIADDAYTLAQFGAPPFVTATQRATVARLLILTEEVHNV